MVSVIDNYFGAKNVCLLGSALWADIKRVSDYNVRAFFIYGYQQTFPCLGHRIFRHT